MGPRSVILLVLIFGLGMRTSAEFSPISYVPKELRRLFHPSEPEEGVVHDGFVERGRRASGTEVEGEFYTVNHPIDGHLSILAKTDCIFYLQYIRKDVGIATIRVDLPQSPATSGYCLPHGGDTAVLNLRWSVFNFSLVFTENPEGNSYYLNKAILRYNQTQNLFPGAAYRGRTQFGWNYYFTPLGKSYVCRNGEDQGPLKLYSAEDELVGNMTLYNTKFQPFAQRAKGDWGPENACLAKWIQVLREDVVPYVVSSILLISIIAVIAGYALFRKFNVKKADYGFYGDDGPPESAGGGKIQFGMDDEDMGPYGERFEMKERNGSVTVGVDDSSFSYANSVQNPAPATDIPQANNPFKANKASNPFK